MSHTRLIRYAARGPRCAKRVAAAIALTCGLANAQAPAEETAPAAQPDQQAASLDLARSVAVTGREAFNAGDYETALALFRRAYTLYPAPTLVLYEARSLHKMGLLLEALQAYGRTTQADVATDAPPQFADAIDQARQEARELEARIPTLTVKVEGVSGYDPNLEVSINGRAIGAAQLGRAQRLNPGRYRVQGAVSADRTDASETALVEGHTATVVLNLAAPDLTPPAPTITTAPPVDDLSSRGQPIPTLTYVAAGVGVAGVGVGLVTGLMATSEHSNATEKCRENDCLAGSDGANSAAAFRSLRTVSTISYAVGAAGLATGVILWLTADDEPLDLHARAIQPWLSHESVGVSGVF